MVSVDVYPDESGEVEVSLFDDSGYLVDSATKNVSSGSGAVTIRLDFHIEKGTGYRLLQTSNPSIKLIRESRSDFPFDIGHNGEFGEITNSTYGTSTTNTNTYYYFYNWTVGTADVICQSPREEVMVEIGFDGNEVVNTLSYTHSGSTDDYGNHFEGDPGNDCEIEEGYLNGYEAVYSYTATEDDLITVELTDLTDYYAGVFIYDSCGALASDCSGAAIAGPSTDDIRIEDFPIEDGTTYYVVVSSWLSPSVDYTINIETFSCADLKTPDGDSPQEFVGGDVMDDLKIDTRTGAEITWYEDSGLTQEVTNPATFDLVDNDSYFVTQTLEGCESPALEIVAEELDCSDLAIIDYTEGEVACRGELTLEAEGSGNGNEIYWYEDDTSTDVIKSGGEFHTSELSQTISYWTAEVRIEEGGGAMNPELLYYKFDESSGGIINHATNPVGDNPATLMGSELSIGGSGLVETGLVGTGASSLSNYVDTGWETDFSGSFTIGFWIDDVDMDAMGNRYIFGDRGSNSFRCSYETLTLGLGLFPDVKFQPGNGLPSLDIDSGDLFDGTGHFLHFVYDAYAGTLEAFIDGQLYKSESASTNITWSKGSGLKIGGHSSSPGLDGAMDEFRIYDRALSQSEITSSIGLVPVDVSVICESPRQEIIANIHQTGEIDLDYTDLPYTDSDNTASFGNSFSGDAGDGCAGKDYLDGPDVSYYFEANPNEDDILEIELIGVNNPDAAFFVYESCGDLGYDCLAGATVDNGLLIEDFYVDAGDEILIVISSSSGSVDYTLNINGVDCNNIGKPTGNTDPYFRSGDMIDDLDINGSAYNDGFRVYRDSSLTDEITDISSEPIVDGDTYYFTQTVIGCESGALEINPVEFDCTLMGIDIPQDLYYVCAPGGEVTITASGTGLGDDIYWYDAETDGNLIGVGSDFTLITDKDTVVWATEAKNKEAATGVMTPELLYYKFDEESRSVINHASTPVGDNPASVLGSELSVGANGLMGTALIGKGGSSSSNYVDTGWETDFSGSFTIGFWIDVSSSTTTSTSYIFGDPGSASFRCFMGGAAPNNGFELRTTNGPLPSLEVDNVFDGPHYIHFVYDYSTGDYKSYVDGVLENTENAGSGVNFPLGSGLKIGGYSSNNGLDGKMDEFRIYNRALNASEIQATVSSSVDVDVVCESSRSEAIVKINDEVPAPPTVKSLQEICGEDTLLSDISVLGKDLRWYNESGIELSPNTEIYEEETYYVTQTIKGCESNEQQVIMDFKENSDQPIADVNQAFEAGEDLSDLEVSGDNLRWYKDRFKSEELPSETLLEDQATYYVTQEVDDMCESVPLGITVHQMLDVDSPLFENFEYYPNPVESKLHISNTENIERIAVYDLTGRKILDKKFGEQQITLNASNWAAATYLIKATVDGTEQTFVVIRK